jgi:N-acetylglucosamine malate deacetylase 1
VSPGNAFVEAMNPYSAYVSDFASLVQRGKSVPLGGFPPLARPQLRPDAPTVLFFAPHPDDETISGGMALRLMREAKMRVFNVAVTQGRLPERHAPRLKELEKACEFLGFGLITTGPHGLDRINPSTRQNDPAHWATAVAVIHRILEQHRPRVIFFPHDRDWNSTHIGAHLLLVDALKMLPSDFECFTVETEFWGQMDDPNLLVEIGQEDLGDLIAATSFHAGEVRRNPYHVILPAYMLDNVRRGGELVGGQGAAAPDFTFALVHRLRRWRGGRLEKFFEDGKQLSRSADIRQLFG